MNNSTVVNQTGRNPLTQTAWRTGGAKGLSAL